MADRAANEIAEPQARDRFLASSSILLGLRYDSGVAQAMFAGVQGMEESSVYQMLVQRGLEKGRVEGRIEGRVEELHLTLRTLLAQKFGRVAPELPGTIPRAALYRCAFLLETVAFPRRTACVASRSAPPACPYARRPTMPSFFAAPRTAFSRSLPPTATRSGQ